MKTHLVVVDVAHAIVGDGDPMRVGAQVRGVGGDGAEGLGRRAEEDAVDHRCILNRDRGDGLGHGEDDVKVFRVEELTEGYDLY